VKNSSRTDAGFGLRPIASSCDQTEVRITEHCDERLKAPGLVGQFHGAGPLTGQD